MGELTSLKVILKWTKKAKKRTFRNFKGSCPHFFEASLTSHSIQSYALASNVVNFAKCQTTTTNMWACNRRRLLTRADKFSSCFPQFSVCREFSVPRILCVPMFWCTNNGLPPSEFAKEKDRVESRAGFLLLKEEQKLEKEMNGYMNWICKAGTTSWSTWSTTAFLLLWDRKPLPWLLLASWEWRTTNWPKPLLHTLSSSL